MEISAAYSFLTHAGKGIDPSPAISGAELPKTGKLYRMLSDIFHRSHGECKIEIVFCPEEDKQENRCREGFINFLKSPSMENGRSIAARLQDVTTNRSGLGLLFLVLGKSESTERLLVSRFPADSGVLADESSGNLTIEFIDRVFMKNSKSYKAALYEYPTHDYSSWRGRAVDKQVGNKETEISDYWIRDFLFSDFCTTSRFGTQRLCRLIKGAVNADDLTLIQKSELIAASRLAHAVSGSPTSIRDFIRHFKLSDEVQRAILRGVSDEIADEQFIIDEVEFEKALPFQTISLDNGALISAPLDSFESVFQVETIAANTDTRRFTTQGKIVDESIRSRQ